MSLPYGREHPEPVLSDPAEEPTGGRPLRAARRRVRVTPASQVAMRRATWTWAGRIPTGAVTLVPGKPGIGKSTLLVWLAAQLSRGKLPGEHDGKPASVIYATTEDSWAYTVAPRLHAAGADLNLVYRVEIEEPDPDAPMSLTLPLDCADLAAEIRRLGAVLLALDPLMSVVDANTDTHKNAEVRRVLEPLARIAEEAGCAVVGLAHFNKSSSSDPLGLITGSSAFGEVIRAALGVVRDPDADDGSAILTQIKNNLGRLDLPSLRYVIESAEVPTKDGPTQVGALRFVGESDRTVHDVLGQGGDVDSPQDVADWLGGHIDSHGQTTEQGRGVPAEEVLKAGGKVGYSVDQLKRAKRRAGVVSRKAGMDGGWMWLRASASAPAANDSEGSEGSEGGKGADGRDGALFVPPSADDQPEGSDKGAAPLCPLPSLPSHPSALPSAAGQRCTACRTLLAPEYVAKGWTTHPYPPCTPEATA